MAKKRSVAKIEEKKVGTRLAARPQIQVVKTKRFRFLSVLIGIIVVVVAGLGIAYALKKKRILLTITSKDDTGTSSVKEVKLKKAKDGSKMFTGTDNDGTTYNLETGSYSDHPPGEGSPEIMWLLKVGDVLAATHNVLRSSFTPTSFLEYDPPTSNDYLTFSTGWKSLIDGNLYSHSWF